MSGWKLTPELTKKIYHYARFPATGVSLRQMVQFGARPSQGTLFRASQFVTEELPIRLAHRVKDLESLPYNLSEMPSIKKVRDWYAQSFEELTSLKTPKLDQDLKQKLFRPKSHPQITELDGHMNGHHNHHHHHHHEKAKDVAIKPEPADMESNNQHHSHNLITTSTENPSLEPWHYNTNPGQKRAINNRRYFANVEQDVIWPPEIYEYNRVITSTLKKIKRRHDAVVTTVAQGVVEWKNSFSADSHTHSRGHGNLKDESVQAFLDRFYMSRIGIRMLIGQHIALNEEPVREDYVGIICTSVPIREMAQLASDNARFICEEYYGLFEAPKIEIVCPEDLTFMYVPGHLNHMLFETIKNSLRAVVEFHGVDADHYPPVKIIVAEGNEDITIKISDEGGGIPRSEVPNAWMYMYTTVKSTPSLDPDFNKSDFKAPMAGFGYGLPISRLYARYFGGDLKLISMEGYGTDVYLHLNRLSSSSEPLQ